MNLKKLPKVFKTEHRAQFSQIDSFQVLNNEHYLMYFMQHRMTALRENLGWDLPTIMKLPVLFLVKSVTINFKRPIIGDSPFTILSYVTGSSGTDISIDCRMVSTDEREHAACTMTVTAIDAKTKRPSAWPQEILQLFYQDQPLD